MLDILLLSYICSLFYSVVCVLFLPGQNPSAHIFYWNLDSLSLLSMDNCRVWWEIAFYLNLLGILHHTLLFWNKENNSIPLFECHFPAYFSLQIIMLASRKFTKNEQVTSHWWDDQLWVSHPEFFLVLQERECCSLNCKEYFTQSQQHNEDKEGGGL